MRRLIGFSSRRSCHEVTDEVKSIGLLSPTAVCGHTALRGEVLRFDVIGSPEGIGDIKIRAAFAAPKIYFLK